MGYTESGIFRSLSNPELKVYSEPCQTSTVERFANIVNSYNHFHKLYLFLRMISAFHVLYFMKWILIFTPEVSFFTQIFTPIAILLSKYFQRKNRSSHQGCSVRKGALRNFVKFTEKHLYQSLFFNKFADLRPVTLLKTDSGTGFFLWILRKVKHL